MSAEEIVAEKITENVIEVENLKKSFGDVLAVNNLNFSVKKGNLFAFLGLNGAGKSTTINILCSIIKKDSGTIKIDNLNLDKDANKIKRKIGIVFQNSVLDGNLNVRQNLFARASLYDMSKKQIQERINYLSKIFDLNDLLNRKFAVLSGGQKRRVDIARALIHSPEILFLDEPTTGLDPKTRVMVWKILEDLRKETNLTIFLTTHYMEEAVRADNVIILDNGIVAANGTPDQLKNRYTTDFVRVISAKDKTLENIFKASKKKFDYKNNSYYAEVENSLSALDFINANVEIIKDFEILKGDMDNVFLNVTGKKLEENL